MTGRLALRCAVAAATVLAVAALAGCGPTTDTRPPHERDRGNGSDSNDRGS